MASESTHPAAPKLDSDQLAQMRTIMSTDRTLMAWIRTALSMLSFGFTIYKVLQGVQNVEHIHTHTPRAAGLLLVGLGVMAMVMGTYEYWITLKELGLERRFSLRRPTLIMSLILSVAGVLLFVAIISRIF